MLRAMLDDHVVAGQSILPGAAAVELLVCAAQLRHGCLEGITFHRPVTASRAAGLELRLEITGQTIRLLHAETGRVYCDARIGANTITEDAMTEAALPFRATDAASVEHLDSDRVYEWFTSLGIAYGPWFRTLKDITRRGHQVSARVTAKGGDGFVLHPSLLDGALQAIGCAAFGPSGALYVPHGIERLVWFDTLGTEIEVSARMVSVSDDQLRGDARLFDRSGRLLAVVSGVSFKRVGAARRPPAERVLHHAVLIEVPGAAVAASIRSWRWCSDTDPAPAEDGEPADLVYSAGSGDEAVADFIRWARSVRARHVVVVARLGMPNCESVLGAARAWRLERPDLRIRAIAVAASTTRARVIAELERDEPEVVLDGDNRAVRALRCVDAIGHPFPLPSGATVVVTGGFGGVGLAIARWLFDRCAARVVLVGRRGFVDEGPAREVIGSLRADGAQLITAAADVTDRAAMARVLREARETLGPIQAVIHGAGVIRDSLLPRKTDADVRAVLAPKVHGAQILDELTLDDPLIWFVLCSSIVSYTGNFGQIDYAAANRFLDAYARKRRAEGRPMQSVAFGPWADVGMAAPLADLARKRGIEPLTPATALDALERAFWVPSAEIAIAHVTAALEQAGLVVEPEHSPRGAAAAVPVAAPAATPRTASIQVQPAELERRLLSEVARFLEVDLDQLDADTDVSDYGVDSILAAQLLRDLERTLGRVLDPSLLFEARTIRALAARLAETAPVAESPAIVRAEPTAPEPLAVATPDARAAIPSAPGTAIAVIGFAARVPGASDLGTFFDGLMTGRSFVGEVPRERFDIDRYYDATGERPGSTRSRWGAFLEGIDRFDPLFYGISPREAALVDPQQRLLLDVASEAAEHAGYGPRLAGSRTGVFVGGAHSEYGQRFFSRPEAIDGHTAVGNSTSILANRLSHAFDFKGPSLSLDTACSSSLVALHLARQSLLCGDSDLALVAGVNVLLRPETFVAFSRGMLLSPTGRCRPFSSHADGYVRAEAAVALLLKPLDRATADGDTIHAVLRGSAVTQDGRTSGLTTPDLDAEVEAMRRALGGADPRSVDYIEAHAVGSTLGDRLELDAIQRVGARCPIGSIKGNIGHCEVASGLMSVIKVLLGFARGVMPPVPPVEGLPSSETQILSAPAPLSPTSRVLVNAFGFGGTNASVLLERRPALLSPGESGEEHLLLLSARSEAAFAATVDRFREALDAPASNIGDMCFTQSAGRRFEPFRAAVVADRSALPARLAGLTPTKAGRRPTVAFLFTGQGSQYVGMGQRLFESNPTFRAAFERCEQILAGHVDVPMRAVLFDADPGRRIDETGYTQPALFTLGWSLAETWRAAGVEPHVVIGHSLGELVAATVAGAMTLEEGLRFTVERARCLQRLPRGGAMAAVLASFERVAPFVEPYSARISVAAINGPESVVISGDAQELEAILIRARDAGIRSRQLTVSHAFHSPLVEPALADIERAASGLARRPLRIPLASNLFGRLLPAGATIDASYWRRHTREPVQFLDGLRSLGAEVLLEIGPDAVLTTMGMAALGSSDRCWATSLRRGRSETRAMLEAAGALFVAGAELDVRALSPGRRRVPVPPSVREPRRVWFDETAPPSAAARPAGSALAPHHLRELLRDEAAQVLKLDRSELSTEVSLRSLGLDSLLAIELAARVEGRLGTKLSLDGIHEDVSIDDLVADLRADQRTAAPLPDPDADLTRGLDLEAYARHARPATMEWLTAGALDKIYVEARGDRMVFVENGERVEVLDAVGGFGSTLFGHNHPDLVAHQKACLDAAMPVHAQGSHRVHTGRLAAALSKKLSSDGRSYVSTFVNTGAEAVENAIKHAEMEYASRADAILREAAKRMARARHDAGDAPLGSEICAALDLPEHARLSRGIDAVDAHNARVLAERPVFFAVDRAFHGKTSGAARLTARTGYRTRFSEGIRVERVSADRWRDLEAGVSALGGDLFVLVEQDGRIEIERHPWTRVAALFLEAVQGEGGVWPLTRSFVEGVRAVADRHGFPIVVDEIQTGFGRCGAFSAAQALGLRGDYYLFGKALGGGLSKIAVLMVDEARYVPEFGVTATSTFSEDDPGVTTALRALDLYDGDRLEARARQVGDRLMRALEDLKRRHPDVIHDVRGVGLLIGVELADFSSSASSFLRHTQEELGRLAASWFLNVARVRTLPTASATSTIRLEPSAYLSQADQDRIVAAFERFATIVERGNLAHLLGHIAGVEPEADQVRDWRHAPGHANVRPEAGDARVAFLTYFTEDDDLLDFAPAAAEIPQPGRNELIRRMHRLVPPRVVRSARIQSRDGRFVHVEMMGLMATSELVEAAMRAGDLDWIRERIDEAVDLAAERGATVVGFGGLTSIVTHNARLAATSKVALTTGNALTVAMGLQGIERGCRAAGVDLTTACVAVVGATGNIGTTYAECMAEQSARLLLIGRRTSQAKLAELADALYGQAFARLRRAPDGLFDGVSGTIAAIEEVRLLARRPTAASGAEIRTLVEACLGDDAPIAVAGDLEALVGADVVLAASNAARPIIEPEHLRSGPLVVCDVAVPRDVSPRVAQLRPDVHVLVGGAVRLPGDPDLDLVAGHLPRGHVYACMAETILLGLEGVKEHFSFGPIRRDAVRDIAALAEAHGFTLGVVEDRAEMGRASDRARAL